MRSRLLIPIIFPWASFLPAAEEKVTYDDHIFPILEQNCLNCHNPDKKKGGLDLSTYQGILSGGSGGTIVSTGDGASSKIFTLSIHSEEPVMPPEGDRIEKKQADLIRSWIDGGLLENAGSTAKKKEQPKFDLSIDVSTEKPEGPLPMPQGLTREPFKVGARTTVVNDMEASPWSPVIALTGQSQVLLYHTETLELLGVLPFPKGNPETLRFHPNGKYLTAGGGIGGKSGTTVTWDITTGKEILQLGREFDSILATDLRPDLSQLALGGPSRFLKIWDTRAREQVHKIKKHTDWITTMRFSPDGTSLASGDRNNGFFIWDSDSGQEVHSLEGHTASITDLKWRGDSKLVVSSSEDGHLILWDTERGRQIKKKKAHPPGILAMDFNRHGMILTSGRDHLVKIWKANLDFQRELTKSSQLVTEVEIGPDGKHLFLADWDGAITVWSTETFKQTGTLNSNPPRIADRLVHLRNGLSETKKTAHETEAKIQHLSAEIPSLKKKQKALKNQISSLEKNLTETKKTQIAHSKKHHLIGVEYEKLLTSARPFTQNVNDTLTQKRSEQKRLENLIKELDAKQTKLTKDLTQARQRLKKLPSIPDSEKQLASLKGRNGHLHQRLQELRQSLETWSKLAQK